MILSEVKAIALQSQAQPAMIPYSLIVKVMPLIIIPAKMSLSPTRLATATTLSKALMILRRYKLPLAVSIK